VALVGEEAVGADFAVELIGDDDLLGPSDLNGTGLGHRVNGGEVDRVSSHVGDLVRLLVQLEILDLCGELVHDTGGVLRVSGHLVEVLIHDDNVLEGGRGFGTNRISDVLNTPLESACKVFHLLELNLHGVARDSALDLSKAEDGGTVEVLTVGW